MLILKRHDRLNEYNIGNALDYILDESHSRMSRAVEFYGLQVAISLGKKLYPCQAKRKEYPDNWILVSRAALSAAHMLSSVRLLEHVVTKRHPKARLQMPFEALLKQTETRYLLNQIINPRTSRKTSYSLSWGDLDRLLVDKRIAQRAYAPLYDVSLRFLFHKDGDNHCNFTRAENILKINKQEAEFDVVRKHYKYLETRSTVFALKGKGNHFAAFVWLDQFGGGYLRPLHPIGNSFAKDLLSKTDDLTALRKFLGQYEFVRTRLKQQDYEMPELRLAAPIQPEEIQIEPLPDKISALI